MKRVLLLVLLAAVMGGFHEWSPARAGTMHIVGRDGKQIKLDATCRRAIVAAPGESLDFSVNVIGQQVHCLIRRPDPFARCVRRLGVPPVVVEKPDHGAGKPGDEIGAARLAGYVASVYACSHAHLR